MEKNKCIDDCKNDDIYKYEYNNSCFKEIPNEIYKDITDTTNYISYFIEISEKIYLDSTFINNKNENLNKIMETIFNDTKNNETFSNLEKLDKTLENVHNLFNNGFDTTNIDEGNDIILPMDKVIFSITKTENQKNQKNNNISRINLGECETKLKEKYNNIPKNDSLYILKIDYLIDNIHKVEYEVYYPFNINKFTKLDLSVCENIKIDVQIPLDIPTTEIDKYNMSSYLYNDICNTFSSKNGIDESIKERQENYKNSNISVCEEGCTFSKYADDIKNAICSCFIKIKMPLISEIKVDKEKLFSNFKNIKNIGNFKMLKCKHLLFDKKNIFKNSANYMVSILSIISLISLFGFFCYDKTSIKNILSKKNEPFTRDENRINDVNNMNENKNNENNLSRKNIDKTMGKKNILNF